MVVLVGLAWAARSTGAPRVGDLFVAVLVVVLYLGPRRIGAEVVDALDGSPASRIGVMRDAVVVAGVTLLGPFLALVVADRLLGRSVWFAVPVIAWLGAAFWFLGRQVGRRS